MRHWSFKKVLFSLVPLAVLFGGTELGLRAAGWPKPDGAFAHNEPFWVMDKDLDNKSISHNEEDSSFSVTTDKHGLRVPVPAQDKRPGLYRIMTLGCSTTFGWGVNDDETYPAVLQDLIDKQGLESTEVINAGQPGYSSFQGVWFWERVLKHFEPDVVLIGYVVQDARKAAYTDLSQAILQKDHRFLKDHVLYNSRSYVGLRSLLGSIQVKAKERESQDEGGVYRVPPAEYSANLRTLIELVQEEDASPVLFGYPLEREGYTQGHRRIMQVASEMIEVPYLNLQPDMETASRTAELYFPRDRGHANAAGNRKIAHWVFNWLREHDLLGAS